MGTEVWICCRVGTGVNDEDRDTLATRLEPLFVDNVKGKNCVPRCYRTTGMPKERPDVWIKDPTRSVVLQVTRSDLSSDHVIPPWILMRCFGQQGNPHEDSWNRSRHLRFHKASCCVGNHRE